VLRNLIIPESQHLKPSSSQVGVTIFINLSALNMLPAIHFHDQPGLQTHKIQNVITIRVLAPELPAIQLLTAQSLPQLSIR